MTDSANPLESDPSPEDPEGYGVLIAMVGALVGYVALGLIFRTAMLNWIIGPLFPLLVLGVLPNTIRRISGNKRTDGEKATWA